MTTAPQPPQPPVPPARPRTGSNVLAIALLVLALIVLVSVITVWTGLRFLSHSVQVHVNNGQGDKKEVSIQTPVGSLEVRKDVDEAQLDLPIYPGAKRVQDHDAATVNMEFGGEEGVRVVVAKFETSDPIEKVRNFYQERVGTEVTKFIEKDSEGKTVFEIKHGGQEKIVALKSGFGGTRIELVRVVHGRAETN